MKRLVAEMSLEKQVLKDCAEVQLSLTENGVPSNIITIAVQ